MYIKALLAVMFITALNSGLSDALYMKRAEFDDPRLFSAAFGKRGSLGVEPERQQQNSDKYYTFNVQRRADEMDDPRFMTMAFGKRSLIPSLADFHRYAIYDKRGADLDDPRFFTGAFGRK